MPQALVAFLRPPPVTSAPSPRPPGSRRPRSTPRQARDFVEATGRLAKTDEIDAEVPARQGTKRSYFRSGKILLLEDASSEPVCESALVRAPYRKGGIS